MRARIEPGKVAGSIMVPPSKSYSQRAFAAGLISTNAIIKNPGHSEDEKAALEIIKALGASVIENADKSLTIRSNGVSPVLDQINCGESGLSARLFLPLAAASERAISITGEGSLLKRTMISILEVLPQLGVHVSHTSGTLPVTVKGPLIPADITIDGKDSSQFLTGLLFAFASAATEPCSITVKEITSIGYLRMTIALLRDFGFQVDWNEKESIITIHPSKSLKQISYRVEGDWSSAAPLISLAALNGNISLAGLNKSSLQPDRTLIELPGISESISWQNDMLRVSKSAIKPFAFDATHCPDLFPVLAVLAAAATGESRITGLHRLYNKESNRDESIRNMLSVFDVLHRVENNTLFINGRNYIAGGIVSSSNDHRIVMAAAIAGTMAQDPVIIEGADAVSKSYPAFFDHLSAIGVRLSLT